MLGVGLYGLLPLILICGGIALAVHHAWAAAAILIAMGVVGLWLMSWYGRSDRMGR